MGKLTIRVHECRIHRPCGRVDITPRAVVVVDNTYRFQTHSHRYTFEPNFDETFVVGNTHRLAVVEVSVYDVVESKSNILSNFIDGTIVGGGGGTAAQQWASSSSNLPAGAAAGPSSASAAAASRRRNRQREAGGVASFFGRRAPNTASSSSSSGAGNGKGKKGSSDGGDGNGLLDGGDANEANLLGRCYLSIERLVHRQPKKRTYVLGTPLADGQNHPQQCSQQQLDGYQNMPPGVAGTITITLTSDSLGEPPTQFRLDDEAEKQFVLRLQRLLLRYDWPKLQVLDLLIANVRDTGERLAGWGSLHSTASGSALANPASASPLNVAGNSMGTLVTSPLAPRVGGSHPVVVNKRFPALTFMRPFLPVTFNELMSALCAQYQGYENTAFRLSLRIDGCTNINRKSHNTSLIGSDSVYVIVRTESEDFVTETTKLQNTMVWDVGNETVLNVVNPSTFAVYVIVMGKSSSQHYEIGRARVSVAPLAHQHTSLRHLFLCTFAGMTLPTVTGVVHLALRPHNFGPIPVPMAALADEFYERLNVFFRRYDVVRVPQVDALVCARLTEHEEYMHDLVVDYGREPGSVRLLITVQEITALQNLPGRELNDREVRVVLAMGESMAKTKARKVRRFVATRFDEGYRFDVARETDLIRLEVVNASKDSTIYGRVDFSCLGIQRGARNERYFYLVGNAGTAAAYISGIVRLNIYSEEIGVPYEVDVDHEKMFYGRLRRYARRRMPENLHRVSLVASMVHDPETFMAQLSSQYGEEDPSLAVYFTVLGCRQLRSRFGGVNPYVVVRLGIDSYQTKYVRHNTEPDYFEFCEFYFDRPSDTVITLIVMDRSEVGDDREIGRAKISLAEVSIGQLYHDFLPLLSPPERRSTFASRRRRRKAARARGKDVEDLDDVDESLPFGFEAHGDDDEDGGRGGAGRNDGTVMDTEKTRPIGSVGFKYTVVDLKIVDATRMRLMARAAARHARALRLQAIGEACPADDEDEDYADTSSMGRSHSGPPGLSGSVVDNSVDSQAQQRGVVSETMNRLGGWFSRVRSLQKVGDRRNGVRQTSGGGGAPANADGGGADASASVSAMSAVRNPADDADRRSVGGGGNTSGGRDMASALSVADVPTHNLMDEGVMNLDTFLAGPVMSNLPSAANSSIDGDYDSLGEARFGRPGASTTRRPGQNGRRRSRALATSDDGDDDGNDSEGQGDELRVLLGRAHAMANPSCLAQRMSSLMYEEPAGAASDPGRRLSTAVAPKYLHLRIVHCRDILSTTRTAPNPYLLFSTMTETHRTRMEFNTASPHYNEEFSIRVDDPSADFLHISVLTDTPYGSKKLGHCVLSLRNVQSGEWHTRWAAFVVNSGRQDAYEQGSVCLSMMGENFGLEYLPSTDAENRLRERVRDFLLAVSPVQLHRLEWFVGEYTNQESDLLMRLFDKYYSTSDVKEDADFEVVVKSVSKLCMDGGMLMSGDCSVAVKLGRKVCGRTRSVYGNDGTFAFDDHLTFRLRNAATSLLRLSVTVNGKEKAGETFISLRDLHRGVVQERTHVLAINARGTNPRPSGLVTVSICSHNFGSTSAPPTAEEDARFYRLQRYLFYYQPEEVAMADVTFSSTLNMNAYLRHLVRCHGPEPGEYNLKLTINRCANLRHVIGQQELNPFCVVRCGMMEYRTSIVDAHHECVFHESFNLIVGVPSLESIEIILFDFTPAKSSEVGRTQVPLKALRQGEINAMRLPIVKNAGTRRAELNGSLEIELYTEDFGATHTRTQSAAWMYPDDPLVSDYLSGFGNTSATSSPATAVAPTSATTMRRNDSGAGFSLFGRRTKSTLSRAASTDLLAAGVSPSAMLTRPSGAAGGKERRNKTGDGGDPSERVSAADRATLLTVGTDGGYDDGGSSPSPAATLGDAENAEEEEAGAEEELPRIGATRGQPSTRFAETVKVTVVGFLGLRNQNDELYIRVTKKDETLVRTKAIPVMEMTTLKQDVSFEVGEQALFTHCILTLKLGTKSMLRSETVCYADFCLARCPPGMVTERRIRLYECKTNRFLGVARLRIDVPIVASTFEGSSLEALPSSTVEPIADDLASLLAHYSPCDLRLLDVFLFRTNEVRRLHRALRQQLCPSVVATVYVAVHNVTLDLVMASPTAAAKHTCIVSASVGDYTAEVTHRAAGSSGGSSGNNSNASLTIFPYGMGRHAVRDLDYCPIRVDITPTGADAVMTLCVKTVQRGSKVVEFGRAVVSLRALLSSAVYDMGEKVTVPLVELRRGSNRVHASLLGSLTFSLYPAAAEAYPSSLRFPPTSLIDFHREYVRYYIERVYRFLKNYDANSCVDLHARLYERYVPTKTWAKGLPELLNSLIDRWGPELDLSGTPPVLRSAK